MLRDSLKSLRCLRWLAIARCSLRWLERVEVVRERVQLRDRIVSQQTHEKPLALQGFVLLLLLHVVLDKLY